MFLSLKMRSFFDVGNQFAFAVIQVENTEIYMKVWA